MINTVRAWLIQKLLTNDEKYLISVAIQERIMLLDALALSDKFTNYQDAQDEIVEYKAIEQLIDKDWN